MLAHAKATMNRLSLLPLSLLTLANGRL